MIISNNSLDNIAIRLVTLPPQHQNLAPPPLELDSRDSLQLSTNISSEYPNLEIAVTNPDSITESALANPPHKSQISSQTARPESQEPPLTDRDNDMLLPETNSLDNTSTEQVSTAHNGENLLTINQQESRCRSQPNAYSAATSETCAFSSEAAPALLFQEDFYTTWPLSAWPPSETNASSSQAESTETNSEAEPLQPTFAQLEEPHTTEETNKAEVSGTANSIAIESSSSTRSKAEAKKTPSAEGPPSQAEEQALKEEKEQQEKQRVEVIYDRIKAERLLHEAKRQAIWADLQTELRRIWREVMLRRKKSEDDYQKSWQKLFLNAG